MRPRTITISLLWSGMNAKKGVGSNHTRAMPWKRSEESQGAVAVELGVCGWSSAAKSQWVEMAQQGTPAARHRQGALLMPGPLKAAHWIGGLAEPLTGPFRATGVHRPF